MYFMLNKLVFKSLINKQVTVRQIVISNNLTGYYFNNQDSDSDYTPDQSPVAE